MNGAYKKVWQHFVDAGFCFGKNNDIRVALRHLLQELEKHMPIVRESSNFNDISGLARNHVCYCRYE
jgi:hypothetical protein